MIEPVLAVVLLAAALPATSAIPDDAALEAAGATIGEIRIETADIFDPSDPKEDAWVHRAANAVHRVTRPAVVRDLLLFQSGDLYVGSRLRECERLLRARRYLYDAVIEPTRYRDGKVDLVVRTRDVWTLTAGFGFSRRGGKNTSRVGVEDSNILGTGKELTVRRIKGIDRDEDLYRYRDPAVGGSRVELQAAWSENSDGDRAAVSIQRPFFAFDTRWAFSVAAVDDSRVVPIYERGEVVRRFREDRRSVDLWGGFAPSRAGLRAGRWRAGFTVERARYSPSEAAPPAAALPEDRKLAFPWIGFETVADRFREAHDLDRIARTEDLNLASEAAVRWGVSAPLFGGDRRRFVYDASWRAGWAPNPRHLLFVTATAGGRFAGRAGENQIVTAAVRWYARDFGNQIFYAALRGATVRRLDGGAQLLLGGESGLRGYPLRYVGGDRSWLLTLEQRFYSDRHLWSLIRVGGAVFADVGRAWTRGKAGDLGVLRDLGIGLRLSSSRSAKAAMLHLDWAFALDGGPSIRRSQLLVTNRETF